MSTKKASLNIHEVRSMYNIASVCILNISICFDVLQNKKPSDSTFIKEGTVIKVPPSAFILMKRFYLL